MKYTLFILFIAFTSTYSDPEDEILVIHSYDAAFFIIFGFISILASCFLVTVFAIYKPLRQRPFDLLLMIALA